jgi:hypothetical protein
MLLGKMSGPKKKKIFLSNIYSFLLWRALGRRTDFSFDCDLLLLLLLFEVSTFLADNKDEERGFFSLDESGDDEEDFRCS